MALRKIIHIDMDAFFASVEQRDNPELRGKPIAVGGSSQRGVVAAASYEARKFGVRSAMPSITASRKCPELIFVKPRFEIYRAVSQQIREIFKEYTPLVEPLSLDEAYLDVTENLRGLPTASVTAKEIRARILDVTGLTASAGVSYNKFLAKLASDQRKPNGQLVIQPHEGEAFIQSLPVGKFHGIGPVTAEKMNRFGIFTGADLKQQSREFLQSHFGKSGNWYYSISRGEDNREVEPERIRRSSGSETTFNQDLFERTAIEAGIIEMAEDVWKWCEKTGMYGRTATVKIKFSNFQQITRSRTLTGAVAEFEKLKQICLELTNSIFPLEIGVRLVGVTLSNFSETKEDPTPSFL